MRPLVGSTWTNFSYRVTNQEIEPTNLRILIARVDLPLPMKRHHKTIIKKNQRANWPVRPNKPTRSPAFNIKETLCKTAGKSGAYLISKSSTVIKKSLLELDGQYAGTRLDSMMAGGSCGSLRLFIWLIAISKLSLKRDDLLFNYTFDGAVLRQNQFIIR